MAITAQDIRREGVVTDDGKLAVPGRDPQPSIELCVPCWDAGKARMAVPGYVECMRRKHG